MAHFVTCIVRYSDSKYCVRTFFYQVMSHALLVPPSISNGRQAHVIVPPVSMVQIVPAKSPFGVFRDVPSPPTSSFRLFGSSRMRHSKAQSDTLAIRLPSSNSRAKRRLLRFLADRCRLSSSAREDIEIEARERLGLPFRAAPPPPSARHTLDAINSPGRQAQLRNAVVPWYV